MGIAPTRLLSLITVLRLLPTYCLCVTVHTAYPDDQRSSHELSSYSSPLREVQSPIYPGLAGAVLIVALARLSDSNRENVKASPRA